MRQIQPRCRPSVSASTDREINGVETFAPLGILRLYREFHACIVHLRVWTEQEAGEREILFTDIVANENNELGCVLIFNRKTVEFARAESWGNAGRAFFFRREKDFRTTRKLAAESITRLNVMGSGG